MRAPQIIVAASVSLGIFQAACRNQLPPTEPSRASDESGPELTTHDTPLAAPLAGPAANDGSLAAKASAGGSHGLPGGGSSAGSGVLPPPPPPGGSGGAAAGTGHIGSLP